MRSARGSVVCGSLACGAFLRAFTVKGLRCAFEAVRARVISPLISLMWLMRIPPTSRPAHFTDGSRYKVNERPTYAFASEPQHWTRTRHIDLHGLYGLLSSPSKYMLTG